MTDKEFICPHCKKKVSLPEDRRIWIEIGKEKAFRELGEFIKGERGTKNNGKRTQRRKGKANANNREGSKFIINQ